MFLVSDNAEDRRKKILEFLDSGETAIAVLLAAANFEWIVRRAIVLLGKSRTGKFTENGGIFSKCHGLDKYKEVWKAEVSDVKEKRLSDVISNWKYFKEEAFPLRHILIHGVKGAVGKNYGRDRVLSMLNASEDVICFANNNGADVFRRIKVRRKDR
jgi:hypothetical protein